MFFLPSMVTAFSALQKHFPTPQQKKITVDFILQSLLIYYSYRLAHNTFAFMRCVGYNTCLAKVDHTLRVQNILCGAEKKIYLFLLL